MNRNQMLDQIRSSREWDVLVVGGGATGLGIAVDAQTRGFRTLLVEAHDFGKGTSSRSTKLVHGGVRYLEQGDISLVFEALHERGLLRQNAPHLVHPLSFVIPCYKWWERPFFGLGMKIYDALAGKRNFAHSKILSKKETLQRIPSVETKHLRGGIAYSDGQFDDARLAITLAQTAADHGATLLNYFRVTSLLKSNHCVTGVEARDEISGQSHTLHAKVVINATGIFADTLRKMDDEKALAMVQPSQGIHLVFDRSFLPGDSAIMVPHTDDGRVLFAIPWYHHTLVGTTDTPRTEAEIEPKALPKEIGFILRNASRYLTKKPSEKDILSVFVGQRPLVRPIKKGGVPTKAISRNHEISVSPNGLLTIVGGKWTTYRKMAEDAVDQAISLDRLPQASCVTKSLPLHGSLTSSGNPSDPLTAYGSDRTKLEQLMEEQPALRELLHPDLPYPLACVVFAIKHEMAMTVEDILARRTRIQFLNSTAAEQCVQKVTNLLATTHSPS